MEHQPPQIVEKKSQNDIFLPSLLNLENVDHLGSEKIKIFRLLGNLASEAISFEKYLVGATTLLNNTEKSFIETRSDELLIWLLERFSVSNETSSFNSHCILHTFSHIITFPFKTKEVLSFFIEVENFFIDLKSVKKLLLENYQDITFVDGSFILTFNQKNTKIYLEVQKEDIFSEKEISMFKKTLPKLIEDFLKKPKVQFIIPNNRELLIKSFQWIIKDLSHEDLPHVFIDFSRQTANSFQFSALVCYTRKYTENSLQEKLNHPDIHIEFTNTHKDENYLKEGVVLSIDIAAHFALSIIDARKKSYLLIQDLIGPFRDINGGLLEKTEQNFELFCKEIKAPIEDLKHFFYGITPQEKQATAPISLLKKIYASMNKKTLVQEIDYFVKEDKDTLCITIKTTHMELEKEFRRKLLSKFPELLIASTYTDGISTVGCALQKSDQVENEQLKSITFSFYKQWSEKKELKQVLKLGCTTHFSSFDPRIGTDEEPSCLLKMLFEGLTKIGPDKIPERALAEKIEISKSGLRYRFYLRKSYWSNKELVTAHDFVYSWETSLRSDFSSPLSYLFYPIKNARNIKEGKLPASKLGIKAVDDFTLDVELQHPIPYFLELCAHSAFSPICKSVDINNPSWPKSLGDFYVCNGPFVIDVVNSKEVILKKNPLFWEENRVKLEKVVISNMTEKESKLLFKSKKLDALLFPFCKNQISISTNNRRKQNTKYVTEVRYLSFNCSKIPFTSKKIRQAFSLALKREYLANNFLGKAIPHFSPYSSLFSQLSLSKNTEEDLRLAKKLFSESLEELKLNPDVLNGEKIYANPHSLGIEKLVAKYINKVFGIKLIPVVVSSSKLFSLIRNKKVNIYIYSWINRIQDPSYFLNTFSSKGNIINYTCWNSEEINNLNKLIHETTCLETRKKLYYQAEKLLYREKPIIPLLLTSIYSQIQSNIFNIFIGDSQEFDIRYCYKK